MIVLTTVSDADGITKFTLRKDCNRSGSGRERDDGRDTHNERQWEWWIKAIY